MQKSISLTLTSFSGLTIHVQDPFVIVIQSSESSRMQVSLVTGIETIAFRAESFWSLQLQTDNFQSSKVAKTSLLTLKSWIEDGPVKI